MKRLFTAMVVGVALAILLASYGQIWVFRTLLRPELPDSSLLALRPDGIVALNAIDAELRKGQTDPEALTRKLGYPASWGPKEPPTRPDDVRVVSPEGRVYVVSRGSPERYTIRAYLPEGGALDFGPIEAGWRRTGTWLTVALAVALIVAVLFSLPVTLPLARGLDRLTQAARRISAGDLSARADVQRGPARETAAAFDAMAARTQELLQSQQHLLEAVSHELRTPTARIRFALEMLDAAKDDADRERRLAAIDQDLAELDDLVAELLTYTRAASREGGPQREELDVRGELERLASHERERRSAVTIEVRADDGLPLHAEPKLFRRAVRNLLSNACRYGDGHVVVSARRDDGAVVVDVCDDGEGIAEAERQRVFEPFVRTESSRSRESGGVGLGLAIVGRIVGLHGGDVAVGPCEELGGARFTTRWPDPGVSKRTA